MQKQECINELYNTFGKTNDIDIKTITDLFNRAKRLVPAWSDENTYSNLCDCFRTNDDLVDRIKEFGVSVLRFDYLVPRYLW